ncbi:MAG: ATP-binding protein [Desulfobacterales bacterium]|nr:ATP-binding protein [Desulfobacterales bacterium]
MITRDITKELITSAKEYPVVTVLGPRQSGKTTLVRMTYPDKPYFSMENPDIRTAAETDPRGFLNNIPQGAVLDEIQRLPVLLSYIQGIVDQKQKPGMFILTGSHQPDIHQAVSQTLAGRTALLTLLPFSLPELCQYKKKWDAYEIIIKGSFPRLHKDNLAVPRFYNGYVQTYVERDVRSIINIKDLNLFQRFLTLLSGRIGQIVNYTSLSNDIGLSVATIKNWISILKASFVIFELNPFFENINKRVIKSPKIYFTDTGLVAHLLGIETINQTKRDPLRGGLYENLIILEILKSQYNQGKRPQLFFYRDTHGNEVDLIIKHQRQLIPIEIKSSATFTNDFLKGIKRFRKLINDSCQEGYVLYNGNDSFHLDNIYIQNILIHKTNLVNFNNI